MINIKNVENRQIQIVLSPEDLEEAIRTVVSELLKEKEVELMESRLTRAAVRERLRVDDTTLWRWNKSGYLKVIKVGRACYYSERDVRAIEEGRA